MSIIIPNFNHGSVLGASVAAHLAQTFAPDEILIVDDCSTDNSLAVAEAICSKNPSVRIIKRSKRGGPNAALKTGLQQSCGDYICFSAADDFVLPDFAANAVNMLNKYPESAYCFFDPSCLIRNTERYVDVPLALAAEPMYFGPEKIEALLRHNYFAIPSNTVIYRRGAIMETDGFPIELEWQADWIINLVLAFRHGVCYQPQVQARFVVDPESYGSKGVNSSKGQRRLLFACLDALEGPYNDVASKFRSAGLVPEMRLRTLFWLLRKPSGRRFLTPRLANRLIAREIWSFLRPLFPIKIRRWMRRHAGR